MRVTVSSNPSSDQQPHRHHLEIGRPDHVLHEPYSPGETEAFARYVSGGEPGNVATARGDGVRSAKALKALILPRWCAAMSCGLVLRSGFCLFRWNRRPHSDALDLSISVRGTRHGLV